MDFNMDKQTMDEAIVKREQVRVEFQNTRASDLGLPATLTIEQWFKTLDHFQWRCAYCSGTYDVLEHFIPLVLQGETSMFNCVPACSHCNSRKLGMHPGSLPWLTPPTLLYIRSYFLSCYENKDAPGHKTPHMQFDNKIQEVTEDSDEYLRVQGVMDWLRISERVLRRMVTRGEIKALSFGGQLRFERDEIRRYIKSCTPTKGKGARRTA